MFYQNYKLGYNLLAYILVLNLFLQGCGNSFDQPIPKKNETNDAIRESSKQFEIQELVERKLATKGWEVNSLYGEKGELKVKAIERHGNFTSKPHELSVSVAPNIDLGHLFLLSLEEQKRIVHFIPPQNNQPGRVIISKGGILGGMKKKKSYQKGDEDQEKEKKEVKIEEMRIADILECAIGGNREAQFRLGERAYEAWRYQGTKGAAYEARIWLGKAAAQGHEGAIALLEELHSNNSKYTVSSKFVDEKPREDNRKKKQKSHQVKRKKIKLADIKELAEYFKKGYKEYLEITSKNCEQLIEFAKKYRSSFMSYKGGVYIKDYETFNDLDSLVKLLINFTRIEEFKIDCGNRDEVEVAKVVAPSIQFYEDLVELHLFDCELSEIMMQVIIESIPCPEKLKVLNLSGNNLENLSTETIALLQLNFSNIQITTNTYQKETTISSIPEIVKEYVETTNIEDFLLELETSVQQAAYEKNNLGMMHKSGLGVDKNYGKAFKLFQQAAKQGYADAQNNLGIMYGNGEEVTKNYKKAFKWFYQAAVQGHVDAQYNVGIMYKNGWVVDKNYKKAFKWFYQAAKEGHVAAQNNLGIMYGNGKGIAKDYYEASKFFQRAVIQGYADAQNNLGMMYKNGCGVVKNYKKAFKLFQQAANQKHAAARYALGQMYEQGKGVEKDEEKATELYIKTANQGHRKASYTLGKLALKGNKLGQKWIIEKAEKKDKEAQYTLGKMYEKGIGIERDEEKAIKLYIQAVKQGHLDATDTFIKLALQGNILVQRLTIEKAEKGDKEVQYILGQMYEQNIGFEKDEDKAAEWYIKAANQGYKDAPNALRSLVARGNSLAQDWVIKN